MRFKQFQSKVKYFCSEEPSVSSGLAAGVTIGIFFLVFIFTFGCRWVFGFVNNKTREGIREVLRGKRKIIAIITKLEKNLLQFGWTSLVLEKIGIVWY